MSQQDQAIQTDGRRRTRRFFGLTLSDVLTLISSMILPLALGIFTVMNSNTQQKEVLRQAESDVLLRRQELEIANKQNDLQQKIAIQRHQDDLLVAYTKEIGEFLERSNGSLTSSSIMATIARAKTLNTIRQLDGLRSSNVIRFLYEAGQLTDTEGAAALDISTAVLVNISESVFETVPKIGKLSLVGVYLRNCTLNNTLLHDIDFSSARFNYFKFSVAELYNVALSSTQLRDVDFSSARLNYFKFSVAELYNVTFSSTQLRDVDFASAILEGVKFSSAQLKKVNFSSAQPGHVSHSCARFDDAEKSFTRLINVDFALTTLQYVYFLFGKLQDADFSSARFDNVHFSSARLDNADFSFSELAKVDFSFAKISYVDFSNAKLKNVNFSFAELWHVKFLSARFVNVNFSSAILRNVDFSDATLEGVQFSSAALVSVHFIMAEMPNTNFVQARCMIARFDYADLSMSVFSHANVKGARFRSNNLTTVNFSDANLQKTIFTDAQFTENQLKSALSIRDAQLPNGTHGPNPNLAANGKADCNSSLLGRWELKSGSVIPMFLDEARSNCYFVLQSYAIGAVMRQSIKLLDAWDSRIWPYSQAVLNARLGNDVSIQLSGISSIRKILNQRNSSSTHSNITMRLHEEMQTLEILVEFRAHFNKTHGNNSWCNDVELFIDYDTESYFLRAPPLRSPSTYIHPNATWIQNSITVAGGNGQGNGMNQLSLPFGLYVDDDETVYVADYENHRIVEWKCGATSGRVTTGGNGQGDGDNQLNNPTDVIVDKQSNSLIISDYRNGRVVRWPRRNGTSGQTIISSITSIDLIMDENGSLYVVDIEEGEVKRFVMGESKGTVVAGGNGRGSRLDQLDNPVYVFVDRDRSVYVSEEGNDRVMKWEEGAKEGIVVAGGQGEGNSLSQLSYPEGVVVDQLGTVYVADGRNNRIMRWRKGDPQGSVIAGGNGYGGQSNQLDHPSGLSFDRHGNLYVVDRNNNRVQKFNIEQTKN